MSPLVPFFVLLALAIAVLYWIILRTASERIVGQYRKLAESLGLDLKIPEPVMKGFIRPEPSLYGQLLGRETSISVPGKGLQNTRQIETVLKVQLQDKDFAAQITSAGLLGGIRQRDGRGMERWKSGDARFDSNCDIRIKPGLRVDSVFNSSIREKITSFLKEGKGTIYIGGGVMAYAELGLISKETTRNRFEKMAAFLGDLGETIDSDSGL